MNYLAHIHIADYCNSDIAGNLLGDFIKGDPSGKFPAHIVQGIKLHRFVDSYTDQHPLMKQAKLCFPPQLRRFAPIALDVFWDHCLSTHWLDYHLQPYKEPLQQFCRRMQLQCDNTIENLPEPYLRVTESMWQDEWLLSYTEMDNIRFALKRISQRSARIAPVAECYGTLERRHSLLNELFADLYPDLLKQAANF